MISAVVVTYNSAGRIAQCLESLALLGPETEIVVVDNASADGSADLVRTTVQHAHVIELPENVGFGRASNAGAEASSGTHVLFLNPDTVVTHVEKEELAALLAEEPFGLAAPALEDEPVRERPETSLAADLVEHTFGTLRPRELRARRSTGTAGSSTWVSAALLLVRRDEFLGLGGFDRRYFLYYEDRDLSRRYRTAGLPLRTTGAIRGQHAGTASSAADDLRIAPMGWSFLGWIQYTALHGGRPRAARAARTALWTLRLIHASLRPLNVGRARRKRHQLAELLDFLRTHPDDDSGFVPDAAEIMRRRRA